MRETRMRSLRTAGALEVKPHSQLHEYATKLIVFLKMGELMSPARKRASFARRSLAEQMRRGSERVEPRQAAMGFRWTDRMTRYARTRRGNLRFSWQTAGGL
jgi:hypothetical protein